MRKRAAEATFCDAKATESDRKGQFVSPRRGDGMLPVVANGRLYIRTPRGLICLKVFARELPFLPGIGG
ncbi:MAG: hypothetical protein AMS16_02000 [Planctomycetes bacterium DG_58]|nr:MAG: hypothetical protein AMS16_02000 [Planctomycetes bacterium DG_58]